MLDLWDSGGSSLRPPGGPEPEGPGHGGPERTPETPAQAPTVDIGATGLSPRVAEPMVFGLAQAYGPAWQQDYGTIAGRTLTGATPAEAFPDATTPERQQYRDALAHILSPGQPGADHPDVRPALSGALADGMPQADRAVVNRAALTAVVERDPEALLGHDPDIPREQLVAWQTLAMKEVPQSMLDRMEAMNGPIRQAHQAESEARRYREPRENINVPSPPMLWQPLDISRARGGVLSGGVVNMDYYAVTVRMPDGWEPGRMLNHVREHINDFVDTSKSEFEPYPNQPGGGDNVGRWSDDDPRTPVRPTGSFVHIDLPGPKNATVGVIDAGPDHWTFAAVQSPMDGAHPVSGNRQFGYTENDNGTVTFYTRGVDRITTLGMAAANTVGNPVFNGGNDLWQSFQIKLATYVHENGGAAIVEPPVIRRPDWDQVQAVLEGDERVETFMRRQAQR